MRKSSVVIAAVGVSAAFALAACSSSGSGSSSSSAAPAGNSGGSSSSAAASGSSGSSGSGAIDGKNQKVGIILPDTISSPRWITADPTALKTACTTYKLNCNIQNANGSAQRMKTIAQQMESSGVKVLMIVDLDAASGAAIEQQAKKAGVITVDYDRLTPGGGAALYVSFDNVKVGQAQGKALTQFPQVKNQKSVQCTPQSRISPYRYTLRNVPPIPRHPIAVSNSCRHFISSGINAIESSSFGGLLARRSRLAAGVSRT